MPAVGQAGNIGIYDSCAPSTDYAAAVTALGHTPVAVTTLDAASLQNLDGLIMQLCAGSPAANPALDEAVAGGMAAFVMTRRPTVASSPNLPGAPALVTNNFGETGYCMLDVTPVPASAGQTGPAGTLDDNSLDQTATCASSGMATAASLPAGATRFVVNAANVDEVGAFGYAHGNGQVVFSAMQFSAFLQGGTVPTPTYQTLFTNLLSWAIEGSQQTTCTSEGYKGAQLTWCKNICENGLTGQVLDTWIHRWINRYRDLPYCAVEGGEGGGDNPA